MVLRQVEHKKEATMETGKKKYEAPVVKKTKFEDKALVAFATCRKQGDLRMDIGCCENSTTGQPGPTGFADS